MSSAYEYDIASDPILNGHNASICNNLKESATNSNFRTSEAETADEYAKLRKFHTIITSVTGNTLYGTIVPLYATLSDLDFDSMRDKIVNNVPMDRDLTESTYVRLSLFNILKYVQDGIPLRIKRNDSKRLLANVSNALSKSSTNRVNTVTLDRETTATLRNLLTKLGGMFTSNTVGEILDSHNDRLI